ncbi:hypothetical protein E2C01_010383 [Portunus trituberculatus]|uniref:Reverse transcriptase zinc-binding domain-containing protein n=1 Tax=Portunus trituberculatus TaxID=210409 RepID=A0A5B7D8H1_PORTR|nr:hypothetical protein [Portunus trituberculatus]
MRQPRTERMDWMTIPMLQRRQSSAALLTTFMGQYRSTTSLTTLDMVTHLNDVANDHLRLERTILAGHLHRPRLSRDRFCPWCTIIPETIQHFLLHCPCFHSHRTALRSQLTTRLAQPQGSTPPVNLPTTNLLCILEDGQVPCQ